MFFLHKNICCGYSLESPCKHDSKEYTQHMFLWRTDENYSLIIIKYPPYLFFCNQTKSCFPAVKALCILFPKDPLFRLFNWLKTFMGLQLKWLFAILQHGFCDALWYILANSSSTSLTSLSVSLLSCCQTTRFKHTLATRDTISITASIISQVLSCASLKI